MLVTLKKRSRHGEQTYILYYSRRVPIPVLFLAYYMINKNILYTQNIFIFLPCSYKFNIIFINAMFNIV